MKIDIKKCFDRINDDKLMSMLQLSQNIKKIVWSTLTVGVLNGRSKTNEGYSTRWPDITNCMQYKMELKIYGMNDMVKIGHFNEV